MTDAKSYYKYQKNTHRRILFTGAKVFNIKEKFNRQNDHVYTKSCYWDRAGKGRYLSKKRPVLTNSRD